MTRTFKNMNYYNALRAINEAFIWAKEHSIKVSADELIPVAAEQYKCSKSKLSDYYFGIKTLEI